MSLDAKILSISEKSTKDWLEASPVCTKIVDLSFNLQFMSTAGIVALGIDDINAYYNKPYPLEFYPQPYANIWQECYKEVKKTHQAVQKDILAVSLKAEELWFDTTFIPIFDDNNILDYIIVTSVYISDRKKTEKEFEELNTKLELLVAQRTDKLEQTNERLTLALLGNEDGVWDWNLVTNDVYFSPRWKEMLGYEDNEIPNDFSEWETRAHPEDVAKVLQDIQEHIDGKSEYVDNEHRLKHKDGHWVWIHDRAKAVFDKDAKAVRMIGTHTDITTQKNTEDSFRRARDNFKAIYDGSKDAIAILDEESNFLQVNNEYIRMTGMSEEELLSTSCIALSAPEDVERSVKALEEAYELGFIKNYEKRCLIKDGSYINVNMSISILDNPTRVLINVRDVTLDKKLQNSLNEQNKLTESIIDTLPVRIFWKDKEGKYLGANKVFLEDAQLSSKDEIIGKNDFEMPWGETEANLYRADDLKVMNSDTPVLNFKETQTDDKGNIISLLTSKIPLKSTNGKLIGILGTYIDITKQHMMEEQLREQKDALDHQAHHDALTELPNRVLFHDRLEHAIEEAKRNTTKVALLFIDLDHFKEINDSLGHDIGDNVLKKVTSRLQETIRDKDMIARLGGDEFTVILENINQVQDASLIGEKLLKILAKPIECKITNTFLNVSSSIGISIYPDDGQTPQDLLKYADSAMYKAKDEGRDNYQYYNSEMTELAFERVVMQTALKAGIENEELVVYYQPQVNGNTNKLIGMEALVRWEHPTMGLVSPAKFIPLAESTGLIIELDRYVMKMAMTQIAHWYEQGLNPGVLAMNLAVKQLNQSDFIETLKSLMIETECKAEWLELEVTEGQVMTNPEGSINMLQKISKLGVELAIDDFGTGYSSLAYLKRLPISKLKIDQEFVRDLPDDEEDSAIAKAVIALSNSLNLRVIAEGVETKEQRDFLIANGCENIQGYFYSKPVPTDEFEKILKDRFKG
ncbi:MAG: EAL domain-containing protein [Campylobacterota bacterium]|nr:EAL domain-containing protein [Campylobacterota bacterium]